MFRRQTNSQIDALCRRQRAFVGQFLCDGKQGQDEEALIPGLIPAVRKALAGQSPELTLVLQDLIGHGRPGGVPCQTGYEGVVLSLHLGIAMINCD